MNTKKMLAILAALSMLGTTGLTVGAEDTARKSQKQEQKPLLRMKQKWKSTKLR